MKVSSLSIVIPCYNTQTTVSDVIKQAYTVGRRVSNKLEILALDDASTDGTADILQKLKKHIPVLRILSHATNQGYGITIKTLYTKARYAWIFSLPSDDQFDAKEIETLLQHTREADMILGKREIRNDSPRRKLQSAVYNGLFRLFFNLRLTDINTIRLMKKRIIDSIELRTNSAFVDAELAIRANQQSFRILEIPVVHKSRLDNGGSGGKFFKTILPTIIDMVKMKIS